MMELSSLLSETRHSRPANIAREGGDIVDASPRVLKIIQGRVHGLDIWAIVDTGAVPDILSLFCIEALPEALRNH